MCDLICDVIGSTVFEAANLQYG